MANKSTAVNVSVQARNNWTGKTENMVCMRVTATMYVCQDEAGYEYRFRKVDGMIHPSKRQNTHTLSMESMGKLSGL